MNFELIEQLTEQQIEQLYLMYQLEWWSKGREILEIQSMLKNTNLIVAFCESKSKKLVAFSRIITDYVYRGLILDVIVESNYRSQGLGRLLIENIINHPQLKSVESLLLFCDLEMVDFYKKWGFTDELGRIKLMGKKGIK